MVTWKVAIEPKYHCKCLVEYYNKGRNDAAACDIHQENAVTNDNVEDQCSTNK